jgi:transposase
MKRTSKLPMNLLPKIPGLRLADTTIDAEEVSFTLASTALPVDCPACGQKTSRLHSHYQRTVADLPWGERCVRLLLSVRKFRCPQKGCSRRIFTERLPNLVEPYARKTVRLHEILELVGFALGGNAGARLIRRLGMETSPTTLLRYIRGAATATHPAPEVVGVDDFALLRGKRYGTIIVDLDSHHPIELLPDRSAETLAAWLKEHPSLQVISRDRSTEYERGIEEGAPEAVEVLDRWHLLKNLREAAERVLEHNHEALSAVRIPSSSDQEPSQESSTHEHTPEPRAAKERAAGEAARRKRLASYKKVKKLHAQGMNMLAICRTLGMSREAVRRYVHADSFPERRRPPREPSMLDPFEPYLGKRWKEGCRNASQLWREIQEQGYPGTPKRVLEWARQRREEPAPSTPGRYQDSMARRGQRRTLGKPVGNADRAPSPKRLVWLLLGDPEALEKAERRALDEMLEVSTDVATIYPLIQRFEKMIKNTNSDGQAEKLDGWLREALASGVKDFGTFARGLKREQSGVEAALTLPYSNGQTEGQINKLKLIKRQMYGRGSFEMLRQRVLGAA